jgi:hypothetical protein
VRSPGDGWALNAPDLTVDGGMYCRGVHVDGGLNIYGATIGSTLEFVHLDRHVAQARFVRMGSGEPGSWPGRRKARQFWPGSPAAQPEHDDLGTEPGMPVSVSGNSPSRTVRPSASKPSPQAVRPVNSRRP